MSTHARMRRTSGIAAGIGTHLLFGFTVWHLFWFLKGCPSQISDDWLVADVALALQFAIPHSVLLLPSARCSINRMIGAPFYGLLFCFATCISLLCLFAFWRTSSTPVWNLSGYGRLAVEGAFVSSWVGLFYGIHLTGLGYQTGWTPWWYWLRGLEQPKRGFTPRGAYLRIRHPVYLCFLGLIWFNPAMSLDRLLLAGIWSGYIFVGSYLKDERLAFYIGQPYRDYQTRVVGYPLAFFGPLAKRRSVATARRDDHLEPRAIDASSRLAA